MSKIIQKLLRDKSIGYVFLFLSVLLISFISFRYLKVSQFAAPAAAITLTDNLLKGYLWSDNIGWISLSCTNPGEDCDKSNYQVYVEAFDLNKFSGYAWSENIGWIRFDPVPGNTEGASSRCPAPASPCYPEAPEYSARLVSALDGRAKVDGWIRVCSMLSDAANCAGDIKLNNGGWDGWIKMSGGTNNCPAISEYSPPAALPGKSYETCLNTVGENAYLEGYAWGGDVVGWIQFKKGTGADGCGGGGNCIPNPNGSVRFQPVRPR